MRNIVKHSPRCSSCHEGMATLPKLPAFNKVSVSVALKRSLRALEAMLPRCWLSLRAERGGGAKSSNPSIEDADRPVNHWILA